MGQLFRDVERSALLPLPVDRFKDAYDRALAVWRQVAA
jgi:hypothetical protein